MGQEFSPRAHFLPFLSGQPEGVYFGLFTATFLICWFLPEPPALSQLLGGIKFKHSYPVRPWPEGTK